MFRIQRSSLANEGLITYVRPLVEYASCVWSPSSVGLIRKIEADQKRFTKRLQGFNFLDYHERLALLDLESLELRRLKADLCMTYKIMFNLFDINVDFFWVNYTWPSIHSRQTTL